MNACNMAAANGRTRVAVMQIWLWRLWSRHRFNWIWDIIDGGWMLRTKVTASMISLITKGEDWRRIEQELLARAPQRIEFANPGYGTC
jgi:hypothetical protein